MSSNISVFETHYGKGAREGLKEGETKKPLVIAKNLKNTGMPLSQIATITGLSKNEIKTI